MFERIREYIYPELRLVRLHPNRQIIFKRIQLRVFPHKHRSFLLLIYFLLYASLTVGLQKFQSYRIAITFAAIAAVAVMITTLTRSRIRRSIRIELRRFGLPICVHCGYEITGIDGRTCPECGKPIVDPVDA